MKRVLTIITLVFAVVMAAAAQNPIRWRMTVKMTTETEGTVTLRALLEPGWHLYGMTMPANGPKPTKFDFQLTGVKLSGKMTVSQAADTHHDEMFGQDLSWWDSNVTFTQKFTLERREGARIGVTVSYMGCNDQTCLPPATQTLTYNFK